ncbi:divergent polysaccharide deacetylase family protein [Fundidesulfovibrio soli]|uniref:divergent polysaccharide deacetylase family protein n=1 Tax=Fundidesulfovibrio soli TaxID=2922716 RepID=UPI001FAF7DA7|nr:divergent polysaccharide deacetylase family protein [Fundidesulfovibrio soli]
MPPKRPGSKPRRRSTKTKRGQGKAPAALVFLAGAAVALLIMFFGYAFFYLPGQKTPPAKPQSASVQTPAQTPAQAPAKPAPEAGQAQAPASPQAPGQPPAQPAAEPQPAQLPAPSGPLLTIVIDDLGGSKEQAQELLDLGFPVTFSIMPNLAHTRDVDEMAAKAKQEVILHQPMEAKAQAAAPAGTLRPGMSPREVAGILSAHLAQVPHAAGVSNHQGSQATEDQALMAAVMAELKLRPALFFLDSRTSDKSVGWKEAARAGVPALSRAVFIDAERGQQAAMLALRQAEREAKSKGRAVAIGHPHPETIAALAGWAMRRDKGVTIVTLGAQLKGG